MKTNNNNRNFENYELGISSDLSNLIEMRVLIASHLNSEEGRAAALKKYNSKMSAVFNSVDTGYMKRLIASFLIASFVFTQALPLGFSAQLSTTSQEAPATSDVTSEFNTQLQAKQISSSSIEQLIKNSGALSMAAPNLSPIKMEMVDPEVSKNLKPIENIDVSSLKSVFQSEAAEVKAIFGEEAAGSNQVTESNVRCRQSNPLTCSGTMTSRISFYGEDNQLIGTKVITTDYADNAADPSIIWYDADQNEVARYEALTPEEQAEASEALGSVPGMKLVLKPMVQCTDVVGGSECSTEQTTIYASGRFMLGRKIEESSTTSDNVKTTWMNTDEQVLFVHNTNGDEVDTITIPGADFETVITLDEEGNWDTATLNYNDGSVEVYDELVKIKPKYVYYMVNCFRSPCPQGGIKMMPVFFKPAPHLTYLTTLGDMQIYGRIISSETPNADGTITVETHNYLPNQAGLDVHHVVTSQLGADRRILSYEVTEDDVLIERAEFFYNEAGQRTKIEYFQLNHDTGEMELRVTHFYDYHENGKMKSELIVFEAPEYGYDSLEVTYDDQGELIRRETNYADGTTRTEDYATLSNGASYEEIEFRNAADQVVWMETYEDGKRTQRNEFDYKGKLLVEFREYRNNASGEFALYSTVTYEHHENGRTKTNAQTWEPGFNLTDLRSRVITYDENGTPITKTTLSVFGGDEDNLRTVIEAWDGENMAVIADSLFANELKETLKWMGFDVSYKILDDGQLRIEVVDNKVYAKEPTSGFHSMVFTVNRDGSEVMMENISYYPEHDSEFYAPLINAQLLFDGMEKLWLRTNPHADMPVPADLNPHLLVMLTELTDVVSSLKLLNDCSGYFGYPCKATLAIHFTHNNVEYELYRDGENVVLKNRVIVEAFTIETSTNAGGEPNLKIEVDKYGAAMVTWNGKTLRGKFNPETMKIEIASYSKWYGEYPIFWDDMPDLNGVKPLVEENAPVSAGELEAPILKSDIVRWPYYGYSDKWTLSFKMGENGMVLTQFQVVNNPSYYRFPHMSVLNEDVPLLEKTDAEKVPSLDQLVYPGYYYPFNSVSTYNFGVEEYEGATYGKEGMLSSYIKGDLENPESTTHYVYDDLTYAPQTVLAKEVRERWNRGYYFKLAIICAEGSTCSMPASDTRTHEVIDYEYEVINGKAVKSVISSTATTKGLVDGEWIENYQRVENKTFLFHDAEGNETGSLHVWLVESKGEFDRSGGYYHNRDTDKFTHTYISVSENNSDLYDLLADEDKDLSKEEALEAFEAAATLKNVTHYSDNTYSWNARLFSIDYAKNDANQFKARLVRMKGGQTYIVVDGADVLGEDGAGGKDILFKNWQQKDGYSVFFGAGHKYNHNKYNSEYVGYGLVFKKDVRNEDGTYVQTIVVVNYPDANVVRLDGVDYLISMDDEGNVVLEDLTVVLTIAKARATVDAILKDYREGLEFPLDAERLAEIYGNHADLRKALLDVLHQLREDLSLSLPGIINGSQQAPKAAQELEWFVRGELNTTYRALTGANMVLNGVEIDVSELSALMREAVLATYGEESPIPFPFLGKPEDFLVLKGITRDMLPQSFHSENACSLGILTPAMCPAVVFLPQPNGQDFQHIIAEFLKVHPELFEGEYDNDRVIAVMKDGDLILLEEAVAALGISDWFATTELDEVEPGVFRLRVIRTNTEEVAVEALFRLNEDGSVSYVEDSFRFYGATIPSEVIKHYGLVFQREYSGSRAEGLGFDVFEILRASVVFSIIFFPDDERLGLRLETASDLDAEEAEAKLGLKPSHIMVSEHAGMACLGTGCGAPNHTTTSYFDSAGNLIGQKVITVTTYWDNSHPMSTDTVWYLPDGTEVFRTRVIAEGGGIKFQPVVEVKSDAEDIDDTKEGTQVKVGTEVSLEAVIKDLAANLNWNLMRGNENLGSISSTSSVSRKLSTAGKYTFIFGVTNEAGQFIKKRSVFIEAVA